jgi:hypothetical protein
VRAFQANSPKRLAKQFIALPTVKFVQEIIEVTRLRLLVALEPEQLCNFVLVKFVHGRAV